MTTALRRQSPNAASIDYRNGGKIIDPARATRLESAIARVIAEGKVRTYEKHVRSPRRHGLAPPRRAGCGEGGKDSTVDVAKAVAEYAG